MSLEWLTHKSPSSFSAVNYHGRRKVGGQSKRYKDSLKVYLKDFNINNINTTNCSDVGKCCI